jgi:N-acetylneuraminate synthase
MSSGVLVIAEAGVNHNGSVEIAERLIDVAAASGADVVKFQTFRADKLATSRAPKADYQRSTTSDSQTQQDMLAALELSDQAHVHLARHCEKAGIAFMSTAFDEESLAMLSKIAMPAIKVPSGDVTHAPLLLEVARLKRPILLSTGMCTLADVENALGVIAFGLGNEDAIPSGRHECAEAYASEAGQQLLRTHVTLLHCVTDYPASVQTVNLRAMQTLGSAFGLPVGYSDHTTGIEVALAAVALGATVIEKHFTLDTAMPGPDHAASLDPDGLRALVVGIRAVSSALGSGRKYPTAAERSNRIVARRSIVAKRSIKRGERFALENLACKRPGDGRNPIEIWDLLGRTAERDYGEDEAIES